METSNLQTFLTVTATGSFTKAAEQSFLSAPAVMKQINKLEQELGVALFTRTSTGVTLTPAGERFKGYAEQIVSLVNQALVAGHQFGGQPPVRRPAPGNPAGHFFDAPQRPLHGHLEPPPHRPA